MQDKKHPSLRLSIYWELPVVYCNVEKTQNGSFQGLDPREISFFDFHRRDRRQEAAQSILPSNKLRDSPSAGVRKNCVATIRLVNTTALK
jgi:hypothetical protein